VKLPEFSTMQIEIGHDSYYSRNRQMQNTSIYAKEMFRAPKRCRASERQKYWDSRTLLFYSPTWAIDKVDNR